MHLREERTWKLRGLLGMTRELPTFADPGQDADTWYMPIYQIQNPKLVGKTSKVNIIKRLGLPKSLTNLEGIGLWRAIKKALAGEDPALAWRAPITSDVQTKLMLPDYKELRAPSHRPWNPC